MSNARTSYDYRTVVVSSPRAGVVLATLSRPERLNAITFEMFDEFRVLQRAFDADPRSTRAGPHRRRAWLLRWP